MARTSLALVLSTCAIGARADTLPVAADSQTNSTSVKALAGALPNLIARDRAGVTLIPHAQFDLSAIPTGANVTKATLRQAVINSKENAASSHPMELEVALTSVGPQGDPGNVGPQGPAGAGATGQTVKDKDGNAFGTLMYFDGYCSLGQGPRPFVS